MSTAAVTAANTAPSNMVSLAPSAPIHTISILVRNKPGVLVRIALVFARRGYNIESLVVSADAANAAFSRMTITCSGDPETLLQISEQYNAKVVDYGPDSLVLRLYGVSAKLDAFFDLMQQYNVVELMRSGKVLMAR